MRINGAEFLRLVEQAQRLEDFEEGIAALARALPADPHAIVEFFDVPTGDSFDVKPAQAISYFAAKGLKPTFSYLDMQGSAHDHAFTVAKMMDVDMLGQMRASLDAAMANGTPFKEWADGIIPTLQAGGWWGRKEVVDPLTKQVVVAQLGSPWRLETIFRTNMQAAYAAGAWQEIQAQKEIAPFLMYDAIDDDRTRPMHAAWDKRTLAVDHPWWSTHYPPNGFNCRCGVIQLSKDELDAMGITPSLDPPKDGTFNWINPRTGDELAIPNGLDPGFVNNSGESWAWKSQQLLKEKTAALQADMQLAAEKAAQAAAAQQAKQAAEAGTAAATAAQKEAAAKAASAALARAKAIAEEKSKQWVAQQQLDLIAKGKETAGPGAAYKIKALAQAQKSQEWPELKPTEKLEQVLGTAAKFKKKTEDASKLSTYKKAVLEGKTPPPAAVKVLKELAATDQQAADEFLAKLTAEKAKIDAAKAAQAAQAAQAAAKAQVTPAAQDIGPQPPNPATLVQYAQKTKGGQAGGFYQDTETGKKYLLKFLASDDEVANEVLASKLYRLAGVDAPELHAIAINGRPTLASAVVDGIREVPAKTLAATPTVRDGFAVDAWLANWDVAGMNWDNTVLVGGKALRIDVGGALRYRALGGLKGQAFGRSVGEIDSLRDGTNRQTTAMFAGMTKADVEASVERVLAIADDDIRAVVMRYGPPDDATRRELADLMIARKADLAKRFPEAAARVRARTAAPEPQKPARVTADEQRRVEESRANGYGFATDSDQVEDNMVVVHAFKRADGSDATRGWLKLRPDAGAKLLKSIGSVSQAGVIDVAPARDAILSAVKSINFRADGGKLLDATVVMKIEDALPKIDAVLAQLDEAAAKDPTARHDPKNQFILAQWRDLLAETLPKAKAGAKAEKFTTQFPDKQIPSTLTWKPPAVAGTSGLQWTRVTGSFEYQAARFERSFATETTKDVSVPGTSVRYEATLPDGTRIVYVPHDSSNAWAMQGVVRIDTPGRSVTSTERVFSSMSEAGIDAERADEIARQHLYLNAFARLKIIRDSTKLAQFNSIKTPGADGVAEKLRFLKAATGVDIEASDGWAKRDGVRQAFGHGRAYQLRPDLDQGDAQRLNETHVVYHNNANLGTDAGSGVFERMKPIIDGGGVFSSLTDRVRRGVPISDASGTSVSSDLGTGGGDYLFTRIRKRSEQAGTGIYWRATALRRMDAISYAGDEFGNTRTGFMEGHRRGQTIADLQTMAQSRSNETIFKAGLSLFDDLDRIVVSSDAEAKDAIAWLKQRGYTSWPDGRKLEDVIITKAKHARKP
jgi:SPP1 gp7 family putative phage head morphogenesis protein